MFTTQPKKQPPFHSFTPSKILQCARDWFAFYQDNNERGTEALEFLVSFQLSQDTSDKRDERLNVNKLIALTQQMENELTTLSLTVTPEKEGVLAKAEKEAIIESFRSLVINDINLEEFAQAQKSMLSFGYSVLMVFAEPSPYSNNVQFKIENCNEPQNVFFDRYARDSVKSDGRYCGRRHYVSRDKVLSSLPRGSALYAQVEDLAASKPNEMYMKMYDMMEMTDFYFRAQNKVYFMQLCQDVVIVDAEKWATDFFPLVFMGETRKIPTTSVRSKEGNVSGFKDLYQEKTIPFVKSLMTRQASLNCVFSHIMTTIKNSATGNILLLNDKISLSSSTDITRAGSITISNNSFPSTIGQVTSIGENVLVVPPHAVNPVYLQLLQMIDDQMVEMSGLSGRNFNMQGVSPDQLAGAGNAMEQMIAISGDKINRILTIHINALNHVGKIIMQMLKGSATDEIVAILQKTNLKIVASLNSKVEKINRIRTLEKMIGVVAQYDQEYANVLLMKVFELADFGEKTSSILRAAQSRVDPTLLAFINNEISYDKFVEMRKQAAAEQAKQQQENDPNLKNIQAYKDIESKKADMKAAETAQEFQLKTSKARYDFVLKNQENFLLHENEENKRFNTILNMIKTQIELITKGQNVDSATLNEMFKNMQLMFEDLGKRVLAPKELPVEQMISEQLMTNQPIIEGNGDAEPTSPAT